MKYKVGDRVKVIEEVQSRCIGMAGKVVRERYNIYDVRLNKKHGYSGSQNASGDYIYMFYEGELELVKQGRPRKEKPMKYIVINNDNEKSKTFESKPELKKFLEEIYWLDTAKVYELGSELKVITKIQLRKVK